MQQEIENKIQVIRNTITNLRKHIDFDNSKERLIILNKETESEDFWKDREKAEKILKKRNFQFFSLFHICLSFAVI